MPVPPDPVRALVAFGLILVLAAVALWPRVGVVSRLRRLARLTERVSREDALKHLTNCELSGRRATIESLAGALEVSRGRAHRLLGQLTQQALATTDGDGFGLTDEGRQYGLRMLRAHRLLERWFADRTGITPGEWHERAEQEEHRLSAAEADHLAASLGNPLRDPHGDPIPSGAGDLPPATGIPLTALPAGATATVVHVEDEPAEAYNRLRALGFDPMVPVKLLDTDARGLRLLVAGREQRLDAALAGSVTVEPSAERDTHTILLERLDGLRPGESARVALIAPAVQGPERRRLLDLGVIPGTLVTAELSSPSGDPVAYRIRGALIALRRQQAGGILISKVA